MKKENNLSIRICALYCDDDKKYKDKFIEHHKKLLIPISLCYVTEDINRPQKMDFAAINDIYVNEYNLNLHEFDFSTAKNELLDKVQEDIVIYLDIDEQLVTDPYFIGEILERFSNDENIGGALVKIASYTAYDATNKPYMHVTDAIRIFRSKYRYKNRCHEDVSYSIIADNKKIIFSRILFNHYGYINGYKNTEKLIRNLRLLCKDISEGYEDNEEGYYRQKYALNMLQQTLKDLNNEGINDSNIK